MLKMKVNKVKISIFIVGLVLFFYSLYIFGLDSFEILKTNFNATYLWLYIFVTVLATLPLVWRWEAILRGYGNKTPFWTLLKIQLAGYAVSYVTPSARIGGEPLRIYMLKKEAGVDYKTGTASVILDKYLEYAGALTFGLIGFILLFFVPDMPGIVRSVLIGLIVFCITVLSIIYYRLNKNLGFFYSLAKPILNKHRMKKLSANLKDIDSKLSDFIRNHKKYFFYSYMFYVMSALMFLLEFKFLLLIFGVSSTSLDVILIVVVIGIVNLIPTPMGLGALEASQSGLFEILMGDGSIGLLLSLIHRARGMALSAVGFIIIMFFSGKGVLKKSQEVRV